MRHFRPSGSSGIEIVPHLRDESLESLGTRLNPRADRFAIVIREKSQDLPVVAEFFDSQAAAREPLLAVLILLVLVYPLDRSLDSVIPPSAETTNDLTQSQGPEPEESGDV